MKPILDNEDVRMLEHMTRPIWSLDFNTGEEYQKLLGWYHDYGLTTESPIRDHWAKMEELLGFPPNYKRRFEYMTAVWGTTIRITNQEIPIVIYLSKKGLSIQARNYKVANTIIQKLSKIILKSGKSKIKVV